MPQTRLTAVSYHLQDGRLNPGRDGRRVSAPDVGVAWKLPANGRSRLSAANERAARAEPLKPWPRACVRDMSAPGARVAASNQGSGVRRRAWAELLGRWARAPRLLPPGTSFCPSSFPFIVIPEPWSLHAHPSFPFWQPSVHSVPRAVTRGNCRREKRKIHLPHPPVAWMTVIVQLRSARVTLTSLIGSIPRN